jgi:hypothetical protein
LTTSGVPTGTGAVYFAEYAQPAWTTSGAIVQPHYRVGAIDIGNGTNTWISNVAAGPSVLEAVNHSWWDANYASFSRTLLYRDLDNSGTADLEIFNETGVAYYDAAAGAIRRFQTASVAPKSLSAFPKNYLWGGHVFERPNRSVLTSSHHLAFNPIPVDSLHSSFHGGDGWWYPEVNSNAFQAGQIDSLSQSVHSQELGTSMRHARMRASAQSPVTDHVVVGTVGGFVYAIEPGSPPSGNVPVASQLSWSSDDLGTMVIGLDVGDLDGDDIDEVVAGTWVDTGTYDDWANGDLSVNRGGLYVLKTTSSGGGLFQKTRIDGDSNFAVAGTGMSSAICGIRIDDVDNDGVPEIWCTDALHVYLFRQDTGGVYQCVHQSPDLGYFPGAYNNLFPIKAADGTTAKLVVASIGYVMEFEVHPGVLP